MKRNLLYIILFLIIPLKGYSLTHHSVAHGLWSDEGIWSTNSVPQDGDSIFVHHEVVYGGTHLRLEDVYLEVTVTGCLCGPESDIVFHNSTLIMDGHMAFIHLELHNNSEAWISGTILLTEFLLATSNSSGTITSGFIEITQENDLNCYCFDSTRRDSLVTLIDEDAIVNFSFEDYFDLNSDTMEMCNGEDISLHYNDSVTYQWSSSENTNRITPETEDWYWVTMTQKGDTTTDSVYVLILEKYDYEFPNIYTPNNDQVNDKIVIEHQFMVEFWLFNRWGKNIIEYKGKGLELNNLNISDGTYYYLLKVESPCDANVVEHKGWLEVLR